jgi:hypothetical protein
VLRVRRRLRGAGLLAVVILVLCLMAPERSLGKTDQHPQPTTQGANDLANAWNVLWEGNMNEPAAFLVLCLVGFTGVLAASTIGLWFVTWRSSVRQAAEMEKLRWILVDAANAGRNSADAAKKSADALLSIERAYLFIDEEVELDLVDDSSAVPVGEPASPEKPNYVIKFTFINRGKTPAILESIGMGAVASLQQPTTLEASMLTLRASVPVGSVISANSRYERRLGCPFRMEPAMRKRVEQREARLYFLGRISYKDVFGNARETGFGLEFEPHSQSFMRVLSDELNYYT